MNKPTERLHYLQSVKNGMRILRLFSSERPELRITEIANLLGMSKSSVSRLVNILVQEEFLEQSSTSSRYRPGISLFTLSGVITNNLEIHREALPVLKKLVRDVNETAHISVLEDTNIVYLHKVECKHPVRLESFVGVPNPAFCTSSGKVMLSFRSPREVERVIEAGLPKLGPGSVTDPGVFRRQMTAIRKAGYAVCIEELHEGVTSIGAPILDYTEEVVAAVSIAGPTIRINDESIPNMVKHVIAAGAVISSQLGYTGRLFQHWLAEGKPWSSTVQNPETPL